MKNILLRLFSKDFKEVVDTLVKKRREIDTLREQIRLLENKKNLSKDEIFTLTMQECLSVGEFRVDFSKAHMKTALPEHPYNALSEEEKANFLGNIEVVYKNSSFQSLLNYYVNLYATKSIYSEDPRDMKKFQNCLLAFRQFIKELQEKHAEFVALNAESREDKEEFDPLAVLPDN